MTAPVWTPDEFEILLQNHELGDEEVSDLLQYRTADAVAVVREEIHAYHRAMKISMLSGMMRSRLADPDHRVCCPRCGVEI